MADRPILFSAPMVRALLDGRKSQTRRVLKPQPVRDNGATGIEDKAGRWVFCANTEKGFAEGLPHSRFKMPHAIGDRLWVREAWRAWVEFDKLPPRDIPPGADVQYLADDPLSPWTSRYRHARFMTRWASRLTLTVTDVRVERLRDISEEDALAEGVERLAGSKGPNHFTREITGKWRGSFNAPTAKEVFADLWNNINGPDSWDANPWVAAISFDVRRGNIDEVPK